MKTNAVTLTTQQVRERLNIVPKWISDILERADAEGVNVIYHYNETPFGNFPQAIELETKNAKLNAADLKLMCTLINSFGSGQHPVATDATLNGFTDAYKLQCTAKAQKQLRTLRDKLVGKIELTKSQLRFACSVVNAYGERGTDVRETIAEKNFHIITDPHVLWCVTTALDEVTNLRIKLLA